MKHALVRKTQVGTSLKRGRNCAVVAMNYEPAMSFEQIGARMGMSSQHVFGIYAKAMEKIRAYMSANPGTYREMLGIAQSANTRSRRVFPDWGLQ